MGISLEAQRPLTYNPNPLAGTAYGRLPRRWTPARRLVTEYGLHFTGGLDIALGSGLALTPGVQFDMGLTNTNATNPQTGVSPYPYSDTFWSITATIGIKYTVF